MSHIVVIGAGQAGSSLVSTLRTEGFEGEITLVGAEPVPPYQRPPLSKAYLLGEMARERLFLRAPDWWQENAITLRLGGPATDLDLAAKTVRVGGEELAYDQLALATGLAPRKLPADIGGELDGVYSIRTLEDIDRLEPALRAASRLLVVGGGYIGLEAAAAARKLGLSVTLVEAGLRVLGRVAAEETSGYFRALHAEEGVEILEHAGLERLLGEGRVKGARLSDGAEIPADLVVVGIGLMPSAPLAETAGLEVAGGVLVDAFGRTSDPAVWAAGDCAVLPHDGGRLRLESVQNAIEMAEQVARNMLGAETAYVPKPWFWSDQYDVKLQIAGLNTGYDRVVVRDGERARSRSHWYYAGDRLLAVDAMNDARAYMVGKRLIEGGRSPDPAKVADPEADLKSLLAG
ncbi:3-phenylpropionate/trans-cinnamate dioxygenase ferredoxin reductase subunit [Palleronia aestuarii]|uniref:3-phenylpropionate/trans-cinnamate dioxygenase ferredoxin reductase subunit n=1 Tax=Palleronia aestuarii TaxID=568105 RepID=A0A2W7NL82_9RHOB|nr:FAD-dependent oxidoreductase [Palleronia aestuarii]PZX18867.1 3-phenylpropionate/trans-cinnamate dioxygenase ferredoxin reductase subunit [Palleronia aestuarii]